MLLIFDLVIWGKNINNFFGIEIWLWNFNKNEIQKKKTKLLLMPKKKFEDFTLRSKRDPLTCLPTAYHQIKFCSKVLWFRLKFNLIEVKDGNSGGQKSWNTHF